MPQEKPTKTFNEFGLPTQATLGKWEKLGEGQSFPNPPEDWTGTLPEWAINWALTRLGCVFYFQTALGGGRGIIGGFVADFYVIEPVELFIQVQGMHWHYELGTSKMQQDALQKALIESDGKTVIYIDEDDALKAPIYYTQQALLGIDHSLASKL
jgi:hypothetical protein